MTVDGLAIRFGVKTASSDVNPSLLFVRQFTKAVSAELPRGPIKRSIWATSLPSPTSDSPTHNLSIFAIARSRNQCRTIDSTLRPIALGVALSLFSAFGRGASISPTDRLAG